MSVRCVSPESLYMFGPSDKACHCLHHVAQLAELGFCNKLLSKVNYDY